MLDAQRSLFAAQQALVFFRLEKVANQVSLYAVLGGGWEAEKQSNGPKHWRRRRQSQGAIERKHDTKTRQQHEKTEE